MARMLRLTAVLVVLGVLGVTAPAGAAIFSNPASIAVPQPPATAGKANPYPSNITVAGLTGAVTSVTASIAGFSHTFPGDVDILLVGPSGQNVVLLADTGGATDVNNIGLTFDSAAALPVPTPIVAGTFRPTNNGAFSGTAPAPVPPYGAALTLFNGTVPNGIWSLYVFDDAAGDTGSIAGGWSLNITTNGPTISSFAPATGPAGTAVVITGTNLTGATAVTFGGIPAASFTVNNPTTVTATVPAGATSGPISVTTPAGTASSATPFSVSPPPTITSFSPTTAQVGTSVTIAGTNLTGATGVVFGGIPAATFAVASPTTMTATVPAGAGTGTIQVNAPGGAATSPTSLTISHARRASLNVSRRRARGTLTVSDAYSKCASGVPVRLQLRTRGRWRTVGSDLTSTSGAFSVPGKRKKGVYRAAAPSTTLSSGDVCGAANSPSDRV